METRMGLFLTAAALAAEAQHHEKLSKLTLGKVAKQHRLDAQALRMQLERILSNGRRRLPRVLSEKLRQASL